MNLCQWQRITGSLHVLGDNGENSLTDIAHNLGRQNRVVTMHRTAIIDSRNIGMRHDRHDPVSSRNAGHIHCGDSRMGMRALANQDNQRVVSCWNIVNINGGARHMFVRAVMTFRGADITVNAAAGTRCTHSMLYRLIRWGLVRHHPASSKSAMPNFPLVPTRCGTGVPVMSIAYLISRFCATCMR